MATASRAIWQRRVPLLAFAALGALLVVRLVQYLSMTCTTMRYPFQLDYGEGIVWQQMRAIVAGHGYGSIDGFPAIVFHYPPVYHLVTAALASVTGMDELFAGRLVSMLCTLAVAALLARILLKCAPAAAPRAARLGAAAIIGLTALTIGPIEFWSLFMRVDLLCTALVLAGLLCGLKAIQSPRWIVPAAVLFVLAVYTKQTAIAAPAAVFGTLLFLRPRTALTGIGCAMALGMVVMAGLMIATDGGFVRHIFFYNINRLDLSRLNLVVANLGDHFALMTCGLIGVLQQVKMLRDGSGAGLRGFLARLRSHPAQARVVMLLAYLAITTPMMLMIAKSGASTNYLIEWNLALTLLAGLALVDLLTPLIRSEGASQASAMATVLPVLFIAQLLLHPGMSGWIGKALESQSRDTAAVVETIRAAPAPVISDDMVAVLRGGKPVLWESAIFAELASIGVWDEKPFLDQIRERRFAFFVMTHAEDKRLFNSRYTPAVKAAIDSAYPTVVERGPYRLQFPAGKLPAYAEPLSQQQN